MGIDIYITNSKCHVVKRNEKGIVIEYKHKMWLDIGKYHNGDWVEVSLGEDEEDLICEKLLPLKFEIFKEALRRKIKEKDILYMWTIIEIYKNLILIK